MDKFMYYKLTNSDMTTRNEFKWELAKEYKIDKKLIGPDKELCSNSWFHVYNSPLVAVLLNPIHANIRNPRLFECECSGYCKLDKGLKIGFTKVKFIREIEMPEITISQKIAFGILCTKQVYLEPKWNKWADDWLNNVDRGYCCCRAAVRAAASADAAIVRITNFGHPAAATAAVRAAASATEASAYAITSATVVSAVVAAAVEAASYAVVGHIHLNLCLLAKEAMNY